MGNQLCEATQQSSYKAKILELCNGVDPQQIKLKLEPITFSDHNSDRDNAYHDDQHNESSIEQIAAINTDFSPMLNRRPQVSSFATDHVNEQPDPNRNQKTSSFSSDFLSNSPTTKLSKINLSQVYLKHVNTQHEQGNLNYQPIPVPFSVIKMTLGKNLIPLIEEHKKSFFKTYQKDQKSFKLYKEGCYGYLASSNSGIFINKDYFYEGGFILKQKDGFMPDKYGTYVNEQGKYAGDFKDGKPNGKGRYVLFEGDDHNKRTVFLGHWEDGTLAQGTVENYLFEYKGELKNRQPHGVGKLLIKATKTSYTGEFKHGKFHGQRGFYETLQYTYTGDFIAGKKHGQGVLIEKGSLLQSLSKKMHKEKKYEGTWENDQIKQINVTKTNIA